MRKSVSKKHIWSDHHTVRKEWRVWVDHRPRKTQYWHEKILRKDARCPSYRVAHTRRYSISPPVYWPRDHSRKCYDACRDRSLRSQKNHHPTSLLMRQSSVLERSRIREKMRYTPWTKRSSKINRNNPTICLMLSIIYPIEIFPFRHYWRCDLILKHSKRIGRWFDSFSLYL